MNINNYKSKMRKIAEELIEIEEIMYFNINDELSRKRFWKEVYEKRGLDYKK